MIIQKIGLLAANSTNIQAYVWYTHKHTHTHTQSSAASCAYSRLSKETTMLSHVHTHTHTLAVAVLIHGNVLTQDWQRLCSLNCLRWWDKIAGKPQNASITAITK